MRRAITAFTSIALVGLMIGSGSEPRVRYARPAISQLLSGGSHPERPAEVARAQEWFAALNGNLDPAVAFEATMAAWRQARRVPAAAGALSSGWKELGPKPLREDPTYNDPFNGAPPTGVVAASGLVAALAVDPNDKTGKTVWAGTEAGGVWVSRNGGKSWKTSWDAMPSLSIGAIVFDKTRPKTMYVGTGEGNFAGFSGTGVYRSTNDGKTFVRTARNVKANVTQRIVARGGIVFVATDRGLWRSTDGGNSYVDVKLPTAANGKGTAKGVFANYVSDVVMHPSRPNEITAAVGAPRGKLSGPGNGLYRSTKGGAAGTWTRLDVADLASGSLSDDPIGRMSVTYGRGDVMWALVQDAGLYNGQLKGGQSSVLPTSLNGIYRSGDDGVSWDLKATPQVLAAAPGSGLVGLTALYSPGIQARYNQWIAVSPLDEERVLVGLEEIYQTSQNANGPGPAAWDTIGRYWDMCLYPVNVGCDVAPAGPYAGHITPHADQHSVAFGDGGKILYVGNDGGVATQQSTNGTFSSEGWTPANDTMGTMLAYHATMGTDGTVYAGFQDNGFGTITPDGRGIQTFVGDGGDTAVEPSNSDHAYSEYVGAAVFKTTDGGRNWVSIAPDLGGAQFIAPFEMDPKDEKHLVVGGASIAETTIGTDTVCTNDFLITGTHAGPCDWMASYELGAGDNGVARLASAIDVQGSVVYAGFCGLCTPSTKSDASAKDFLSGIATNRKKGCTPATGMDACWHIAKAKGLPNRIVTDVEIDPANSSVVYATVGGYGSWWRPLDPRTPRLGRGHVFVSRDAGETFTDISRNLPDAPAYSFALRKGRLFAGTQTGVYTASSAGATWQRMGRGFPNTAVMDVNFNPQGTKLLAATYGRGMWAFGF